MKLFTILLFIAAMAGCAVAPPRPASVSRGDYESTQAYLNRLIPYEMSKNKVAGLSIALVDDQRVVWAQGFGFADVERKIPAGAETVYRVGSISKLFTDTAAMQLVERGLLDIDQPVQNYLPGFAPMTRQPQAAITPRQLMTHHSGLPRDRLKGFQNPEPRPFSELANDMSDEYVAYPPDLVFSYSNVGVSLVGNMVQTLSGAPFAQHMQQSVLTPLGMSNSSFDTGPSTSPLMAKGYRGRDAVPETPLRDVPAGGLNSSVSELSRFMAMMFAGGASGDHQVLRAQTVNEMLRPQNSTVALDLNFQVGLGWMLSTLGKSTIENAGPVAHHAGGIGMFHSQMYLLPQHKLGVVVLANSSTAAGVVDHIATEALTLALEAKTGIRQPEHGKTTWTDEPLPAEILRDYVGDYTTVAGPVRISADGNGLRAEAAGHSFKLRQRSDGLFGLDYALLGLISVDLGTLSEIGFSRRSIAGRELLVGRFGTQEMLVGQRIAPPASLGAWQQRLGHYEITNMDGDPKVIARIHLTEERGFLIIELTSLEESGLTPRTVLMPLSNSEALLLGPLADSGETVRSVTVNGVEQLAYSGYLARKITGGRP
jgi:CubicO group peptidase (beta-lactamase class C family)